MRRLRSIFRWVAGILLGSYLSVMLLLSLPIVQTWIGGVVSSVLSERLGCRAEVGRVQLGLTGRLLVDDLKLWDRQGKEMLQVARAGAKVSLLPLLRQGDIHINNALLFGAHAYLYQQQPDSALNLQFIIDAFQTDDEKKPMPHISVGSMLVRHTSIIFDQQWKPKTPGKFNPAHINVSELSLSAQLHHLCDDSLSLDIRKLSFLEQSGFELKNAEAEISKVGDMVKIIDFHCTTPQSTLNMPEVQANISNLRAEGSLRGHITPADGKAFLPRLSELNTGFETELTFLYENNAVHITDLQLSSDDNALQASITSLKANKLKDSIPEISVKVKHLVFTPEVLAYIRPFVNNLPTKAERLANAMGECHIEGDLNLEGKMLRADTRLQTQLGKADVTGTWKEHHLTADLTAEDLAIGKVLSILQHDSIARTDSIPVVGNATFTARADLTIPAHPTFSNTKGSLQANIHEAYVKGYTYHNISAQARHQGETLDIHLSTHDPALTLDFQGNALLAEGHHSLQGLLDVQHFRPQDLHLLRPSDKEDSQRRINIEEVRTKIGIDLAGNRLDNLSGDISIPHVILTDAEGSTTLANIQLMSQGQGEERHLTLQSPYLKAQADGEFEWKDLARFAQQTVHEWLPGFVNAPAAAPQQCRADISLVLTDPTPLERLLGIPFRLTEGPLEAHATVDSGHEILNIRAKAPALAYGEQSISNFSYSTESQQQRMTTALYATRLVKQKPVDLKVQVSAEDKQLRTTISWDNHLTPSTRGDIALRGTILNHNKQLAIEGEVLPSTLQISDTLWNVRPTHLTFRDGVLNVQDLRVTMEDGNRWLYARGKASKNSEDTLLVDLRGIELGYIFDILHVKPLSLQGLVSGNLYGTHLFHHPEAHGNVTIPHFLFNGGDMGTLNAKLAWGATPGNLEIDGRAVDPENQAWMEAKGYLHLIKDPVQSLDLQVSCDHVNLYFMNRYTDGIMEDIEGRGTGNVRIFGTFSGVDLAGSAIVNKGALTIPAIGGRYYIENQSVVLQPDGLTLDNIVGYDHQGGPGIEGHRATVNGRLSYEHFRNMRFNIDITGENILGYNFTDFDDLPFCGVVYGTGNVQISGGPGQTTIDIHARPTSGSQLTYKVATPETLTQSKFITFVDDIGSSDTGDESDRNTDKDDDAPSGDMYLNFDLDITPEAEMKLLMDPVAGDYISLFGNSRMRATYYNKGDFRMYGTFRVDHGIYRLSIQDVIRKDFQFRQGGTIVFGGSPFQADLGLQAIYTVPSVSLNDLSARGTFSNNTVRVNCIMNLGGKAGEPRVTFDFDIPNVNEDELRMVRSLISTEEERNLQVIYLLGIGRFYTYDYADPQAQGSTAMNSLLSTTLSGQLNQIFTNLMGGNQNWNIGANLSTGDMGWSDMDVEGMLSGRLLNNRLLINGNFGYRDNPVAASNFIGDFDLQWLLNRQGNLILKAYSETNDRYFTKSALTTQGVGLLLKKDFIRWSDLFKRKKK